MAQTSGSTLLFFDSSHTPQPSALHARWSVVLAWPVDTYCFQAGDTPQSFLRWAAPYCQVVDVPAGITHLPFVGGIAGVLSFEYAWQLDDIRVEHLPVDLPIAWATAHEQALVYDHDVQKWWAISRSAASCDALQVFVDEVECTKVHEHFIQSFVFDDVSEYVDVSADSDVVAARYVQRVEQARRAILNGEFFEVNYTERFCASWVYNKWSLYQSMAASSSGQYFGYVQTPDWVIASVSPEQFLRIDQDHISTKPIKGSCPRAPDDPERDRQLAKQLLMSEKDRAENMMIVDLMRNDLTRVCIPGTVEATALCALESYAGIHHLVSTVEGRLDPDVSLLEALLSCFPAGSITGAPKLRAMEYIATLEHSARQTYTGSMFYLSCHGRLDSNVLIRTAEVVGERVRYGAGGAVVYDSNPQQEYEEALLKTRPLSSLLRRGDS